MSGIFSRPDFVAGARDMTPPLVGLVCGVGAPAAGASAVEAFGMVTLWLAQRLLPPVVA